MVFVLITSVQSFLSDDWRRPELTIFCGFFALGAAETSIVKWYYRKAARKVSGKMSARSEPWSAASLARQVASRAMSFRNVLRVQRSIVR
jgi:hypothetical protein